MLAGPASPRWTDLANSEPMAPHPMRPNFTIFGCLFTNSLITPNRCSLARTVIFQGDTISA